MEPQPQVTRADDVSAIEVEPAAAPQSDVDLDPRPQVKAKNELRRPDQTRPDQTLSETRVADKVWSQTSLRLVPDKSTTSVT